jgi:integration host factor subunit beta
LISLTSHVRAVFENGRRGYGDDGTMTKSDLIDVLCEAQKLPKGSAELLVHVIFDSMEVALRRGERIEIRGFGSFEIRNYRAYEGRNPRSGAAVSVKPKRLPFFKVGKELKERVNAGAPALARAGAKRAPVPAAADGTPAAKPASTTGPVDAPQAATGEPETPATGPNVNRATA